MWNFWYVYLLFLLSCIFCYVLLHVDSNLLIFLHPCMHPCAWFCILLCISLAYLCMILHTSFTAIPNIWNLKCKFIHKKREYFKSMFFADIRCLFVSPIKMHFNYTLCSLLKKHYVFFVQGVSRSLQLMYTFSSISVHILCNFFSKILYVFNILVLHFDQSFSHRVKKRDRYSFIVKFFDYVLHFCESVQWWRTFYGVLYPLMHFACSFRFVLDLSLGRFFLPPVAAHIPKQ